MWTIGHMRIKSIFFENTLGILNWGRTVKGNLVFNFL